MFVIEFEDSQGRVCYVDAGEWSDYSIGYHMFRAKMFDTMEDVEKCMKSKEFRQRIEYDNGTSFPPSLIWTALGINRENRSASGKFRIIEIKCNIVAETNISDRILP